MWSTTEKLAIFYLVLINLNEQLYEVSAVKAWVVKLPVHVPLFQNPVRRGMQWLQGGSFLSKSPDETSSHPAVPGDPHTAQDNPGKTLYRPATEQNKEELGIFECSKNSPLPTPHISMYPLHSSKLCQTL